MALESASVSPRDASARAMRRWTVLCLLVGVGVLVGAPRSPEPPSAESASDGWRPALYQVAGRPPAEQARPRPAFGIAVPVDFFDHHGFSIRSGRGFDASDAAGAVPVAVIDESLARAAFGDDDPVGAILVVDTRRPLTIVGVVAARRGAARTGPLGPKFFLPSPQAWGDEVAGLRALRGEPAAADALAVSPSPDVG